MGSNSNAPDGLVLITGVTGHLGFRVLRHALETGHRVRAAVRSEAKAQKIASHPLIKGHTASLSFVVVPDFLAESPFEEAVKDVKYIIHVASPLASAAPEGADLEEYFVKPAVRGTLGVLEAAQKQPSVRRIVITSSVAALLPQDFTTNPERYPDLVITGESRFPYDESTLETNIAKYSASKKAALTRAEEFVKARKPSFDVVHIHPTFIYGRDDLVETVNDFQSGTNRIVLAPARGKPPMPAFLFAYVHVDDVARIHVEALQPRVGGDQSFLVTKNEDHLSWDETTKIVAKHFPEAVKNGTLPNNGTYKSIRVRNDMTKTTDTFGPMKGFEEAVTSVVGHYLEVLAKSTKAA